MLPHPPTPGAPGVKPGGETRRQDVCCGGSAGIAHFDISFFGFEQLAHPLYGQQVGPVVLA